MNYIFKKIRILCILTLLLSSGALLAQNLTNLQLLDAVKKNDIVGVKALLKAGADLSFKDSNGTPLVMWAAYKAEVDMLKFLINAGAPYNQKGVIYIDGQKNSFYGHLLGIAAGENNLALVKYLVEELKVNINEVEFQPDHSDLGWTAMEWAFYKEYYNVFDYLIEKGAAIRPKTYPLIDHFFNINAKSGLDIIAKVNQLNTLAKKQKVFSDSLNIYSLIVKGRALIKIKSVREGLDSTKRAASLTETKSGSFNLLKGEATRYIASGYLNNFEYDSAIRYYHHYFNAAPLQIESSIEPVKKALIYSEMREAYRKAGRLNDWEKENVTFQKKLDQAPPKLASTFFYSYGRIMNNKGFKDEASWAYKKVLEVVHSDNEVYAIAAAYYCMMVHPELNERLTILEKVNSFKDQFPKYTSDYEFMSYVYVLNSFVGTEYAVNGDLKNAMAYFDRAQEGAIKPFLDPKFDFLSYDTKSLFTPMKVAQGYYRILASIEPDPTSNRLVSMIANELIKGIIETDRSAKFSELSKYNLKSYSSGLYNELLSGLGKKEAIVFMTAHSIRMAAKFPRSVVYILTPDLKEPKVITISDYSSLSKIMSSSENSTTKMQQLYSAFWQQIQKEIPKKVKKIYFIPDGIMENQIPGNFVNPATSTPVSDTYQIENKKLLSDLLKD